MRWSSSVDLRSVLTVTIRTCIEMSTVGVQVLRRVGKGVGRSRTLTGYCPPVINRVGEFLFKVT